MRKWLALSPNFYVWDYYSLWWTLGQNRPRWHFPVIETMAADLRLYRDDLKLTHVSSEIADWHEENMYVYCETCLESGRLLEGSSRRILPKKLRKRSR